MTEDKFFNRQYYLEILNKRVEGLKDAYRQNIALLGEELIGKTSVILHFLNHYCDPKILPIYISVRIEEFEYFAKRFIGVLLYNFLSNSGIFLKEELDYLIKKSERFIPKTTNKIKTILTNLKRKRKDTTFTELLSLTETIHQETQKFCCIIFDEFQNLEYMKIKNLYRQWIKSLILQKNTMFLIISSAKFKAKKILSENLSSLFGNFEVIMVEPFDSKTSDTFLQDRLGRINLNRILKNFLISFSDGLPFYLEVISAALCKTKSQDTTHNYIEKSAVIDGLEDLLFQETGALNQRYQSYLKNLSEWRVNQEYIRLLYCISNGHNRVKDMVRILHRQKKELLKILNQLLELDVIERNGDFFKISDRIFSFWLKFVHQNKTGALNVDANAQRVAFRDGIDKMIKEFSQDSHKTVVERIAELLYLFENEGVYIGNKRLRLTNFREIKPLKFTYPNIRDGLIGRSTDTLWIIAIKNDFVTEEDITDFSRECRRYKQRIQRRIFITTIDIDTNVRLRALEEKIWTWNLNNVNLLCELFNKPAIIL